MVAVMCIGCQRPQASPIGLIVSGDTAGWITPCGCASNQSGGLARRETLVNHLRRQRPTILVDVGGSASGTTEYHQVKLEFILRGMSLMGLRAHNLGSGETELGPDVLQRLAAATGIAWLSTNLSPNDSDWNPVRMIVERVGDCRVGIAGVIDPELVVGEDWSVQDPVSAVVAAFNDAKVDVRIVLAYMDQAELHSLAAALPEVHAVVGGPTGQAMSPIVVGDVTVMSATNKGKFVGKLAFSAAADSQSFRVVDAELVEVSSKLREDEQQRANLQNYYDRLADFDFPADQTELVSSLISHRDDYVIAGSMSCESCHKSDDTLWHASRHSHAWEVLVAKSAHFDPSCQQCHTTGYGIKGGFHNVASTIGRVHVGCESCHGPSRDHVQNPKTKTPWVASQQCVRCHDRENSPLFHQDTYWAKIVHGVDTDQPNASDSQPNEVEL